jgi:hypothetical protein
MKKENRKEYDIGWDGTRIYAGGCGKRKNPSPSSAFPGCEAEDMYRVVKLANGEYERSYAGAPGLPGRPSISTSMENLFTNGQALGLGNGEASVILRVR